MRWAAISLAVLLGGCSAACPTGKLNDLLAQSPKNNAALAALASAAKADAAGESDPKNKVSCYRVAAVAAWQSEDDSQVLPIAAAGIAACDALPQRDADAPTDCTLIRLAAPMAVQDALARELGRYQAKKDASPGQRLPATDFEPLRRSFDDLEAQFDDVTAVGQSAAGLPVADEVRARTDRYRLIILCNAIKAWTLSGACLGASLDEFTRMAARKQAMVERTGLSNAEVVTRCQSTPAVSPLD